MSRPDAAAAAALDAQIIRPVFLCFLDVLGDPLRACTAGHDLTFSGTGNPDLDGQVFLGIDPTVVDISPVRNKDGGSEAVTARLSGLLAIDGDLLNLVGDRANWQGRLAQLWRIIRDENGVRQGAVQHYYTGWMTSLTIGGSPESQTIEVGIESYLAAYAQASNRTYMDQELYDAGDLSARAAVAIANGTSGNQLVDSTPVRFNGGGSYGFGVNGHMLQELLR